MAKKKRKKKVRVKTRDQLVKELMEANRANKQLCHTNDAIRKTNGKLQLDVDKVTSEWIDAKTSVRKLSQRTEEMILQLGEINSIIEDMYREIYGLVKCLNATREEWLKCKEVVDSNRKTMTFNVSTIIHDSKDGSDDPACQFVGPVGAKADED